MIGVMFVELQISKEIVIWVDSFIYAGKSGFEAGIGKPSKTFKGEFHLEHYLGFHFKLEHLYCFYLS